MLGLFSAKPTHPLADPKEARRIVAEIASHEPSVALGEATGWFESLSGVDDFPLALRFERIVEIAAASLPLARRQTREFLSGMRMSRVQEQQAWTRNHGYWTQLAHALDRCLEEADAQPKAADALRPQLGALLTCQLIAQSGRLRWAQLRYGPIDGAHWTALGAAYLRAVREKLADRDVEPFGPSEGKTTATQEYLKTLVFHAASMDNLLPLEIGLAERFIAHFLPNFQLTNDVRPESVYWVDAGQPQPPTRLAKVPTIAPGLRFFGPGQALDAVRQMHDRIAASNKLPAEVNLGGQYALAVVLPVLDHLAMCWSPKPPTRNYPRHRVKSRVGIVAGLPAIHQQLTGSSFGLEILETWVVEDVSQGGMGAKLVLMRNEWVRIGAIVGMQPEGGDNWLVGAIRRFARETEAQGAVGIETLSKTPYASTATGGSLETELILLDPPRDDSSIRVLLALHEWEEGVPLMTAVAGQRWRLHPDERLESGEGWLIGRCVAEAIPD
jgi:hypothetical protein